MFGTLRLLLVLGLLGWIAPEARSSVGMERLRVVTTIPDLADIANELGGDRVEVLSIAKGTQNIHAVPLKPSVLVAVSRADLFLEMGLSLEHAYVPALLRKARNPKIQPGEPGFVNCSDGWKAINVPDEISRAAAADIHPQGNPHFNLDPEGGAHIARAVLSGLVRVDPEGREYYEERHARYTERLEEAGKRWKELGAKLAGKKVVTYHPDFSYFAERYSMQVVGTVEPKPGVPPSPKDLARLVEQMKSEGCTLVLTARWSNNKNVRFVAEKAGAKVLEVPIMVGGVSGVDSWIAMMDFLHESLVAELGSAQ